MDSNYFFSAFGTFGNPNGFRQTFFLGGNQSIAREIRTFDLKTDAIKLFPQSNIYSIRKDYAGGYNLISYSVYTFAKEQNSDRGGTFIGSSLLFVNKIAAEGLIINALNDFQNSLEKNNLSEDTITINHSDQFSIQKPKDFDKIGFNVREVDELDFTRSNNNYLVVYCETNAAQLQIFFSKAIDLLNVYDTIYFTQSHEIGKFVKQKRIFKIVDADGFKKELDYLEEERLHALQSAIADLKREKENLKEEKTKLVGDLNKQISQNEKRHQENETKIKESKNSLEVIQKEFNQYSEKIEEIIQYLKSEGKVEAAKKRHHENKRSFTDSIHQNRNIDTLSSLSSLNGRVQGKENQPYVNGLASFHSSGRNQEKEFRLDGFKLATLILSLLLIGTLVLCFMWIPKEYLKIIF
ncbi:hypothetical protein [Chryseobacterium jejuense]|uniref:hypothetical protein n=1 Tax=Chryseobacterium jejuense TaxID=445960 RepID=UPI001AE73487|nr:hypothetical protein [Chryseobacterium jejuense]MBP2616590.1 ElaB/YqjD/DUF883 family membrane-anchored ribosome-binding protein [Chryseobacterium jejuense]